MKNLLTFLTLSIILTLSLSGKETPNEIQYAQYYDVLPNVSTCTPGVLKQSVINEVLEKVNHIRSLHRLKPVTYETAGSIMSMEGALNMVASGQGGHVDDPSSPCYTKQGGDARMKSNIEYGGASSTPIGSIIGWMIDDKNADQANEYKVGHRRAIINPFLDRFAFGRADGTPVTGGFFSASLFLYQDYTKGNAVGTEPDFIAYPFEFYPPAYVNKAFYLSFNVIANKQALWENEKVNFAGTTVEMTDDTGKKLNVHSIKNDNEGWGSFPNNLSWKADGLVDNVRYTVNIKNVIVNGSAKDYTYWFNLTDLNHTQPPPTPTLQVPLNLTTGASINTAFSWSLTQNTSKYHFQLSQNEAFTQLIANEKNLPINAFVAKSLDYETKYYWRVASINDAGTSPWSQVFSFTTSTPTPDKPYLAGPANNTVTNSTTPMLSWTRVNGAETYSLQISRDDTFEGFSVRYTKSFLTDTFHVVEASRLNNETDYWWRVKCVNAGGESSYTPSWKFNTGIPLPSPTLTAPANGTETSLTPTLTWNVVPGATSYNVQISDRDDFEKGYIVNELKWEDVKYTVPAGLLTDATTYYWRIKANSSSGSGPFSQALSFVAKSGNSVFDITVNNELEIYPNPVNDNFFLKIKDSDLPIDALIIRDALGNEVKRLESSNATGLSVNMSQYSTGIYFITVYSGNNAYSGKISVVR